MLRVRLGKKNDPSAAIELEQSDDLIAVRSRTNRTLEPVGRVRSPRAEPVADGHLVAAFPEAGVEVFRVPIAKGTRSLDERKRSLREAPDTRFAGSVLVDPKSHEPVLYTENIFIKFKDDLDPDDCKAVLRGANLTVKAELEYATNAFFAEAPEGIGQDVFAIADALLERPDVEYCHPELIRPRARKLIAPEQWHLRQTNIGGVDVNAHANVEAAHQVTRGEGVIIAVIDDGFDIDHPELSTPGKIVAPRDVTVGTDDPRPKDPHPRYPDDHGTACAGVACAAGIGRASGVAPAARLMPIRLSSGLGSLAEAKAFQWAADHGADVISCSWGPTDGAWWDANDPMHQNSFAMPASTKLAIEYALTHGRGGKGCVICFAAGNGNESVDNDGYASHPSVIAVGACNDTGRRSVYSDQGSALWCAFPSGDFGYWRFNHPEPLTKGIWTTDRTGWRGYNGGVPAKGDADGHYCNDFSGTSSACPGVAGVVALVLSVQPSLTHAHVKDLLRAACDRIDPQAGAYDGNGHSALYGYGRLNARTAVDLAQPQPTSGTTVAGTYNVPILDHQSVEVQLTVADQTPIEALSVTVDIRHTYIGDLVVELAPPSSTGMSYITLHDRAGGSTKNLKRTYDATTTQAFASLAGQSCAGVWTLRVRDDAAFDTGTLVSLSIDLQFAHPDRSASAPARATRVIEPKSATPAASATRSAPRGRGTRRAAARR